MILPLAISSSTWSILGILILLYGIRLKRNRSRLPLPPGPKKLPLVRNLFDMPADRQWEAYRDWSKEFDSDIIHVDVAGTSIVVLSSMEAIRDLFDKRSSLYSDRPRMPMLVELMGWDFSTGFLKYGEPKKDPDNQFHDPSQASNAVAVKQFQPQERAAAHALLRRILNDAKDVMHHFKHMAGALIMDVTYGINVDSNTQYVDLVKEAMHGLSTASLPGQFLVDTFPGPKYRKAKHWHKAMRGLLELPFAQAKREIALGIAPPSFTSLSLAALEESKDNENRGQETLVKVTAANMYAAGGDTTAAALGTFVLAMLANPEAQKKAQAELDAVIGIDDLPDFTDAAALPYVSAVVKEVLQWRNVAPIAIPHYLSVDDEYRGYRIPAGSIVVGNAWAILNDEDPEMAAFGFGRRICPGRHLAMSSLWITIASILATMDIQKARDAHGKKIEPSYEYFLGLVA
ncbi:cytochrome P450 [Mycena latifolia]|nr:cytochrome P450 [Mycena latifolia]